MKILLNGEERLIDEKTSLENLIKELELDTKKIAVEKNCEIILPQDFNGTALMDGDRVEIVHFIGGG